MKILYVRGSFPKLSETFIMEELIALKAMGHELRIVALNYTLQPLQPRLLAHALLDHVTYVRDDPGWSPSLRRGTTRIRGALAPAAARRRYFTNLVPHRALVGEVVATLGRAHREQPWRERFARMRRDVLDVVDVSLRAGNLSFAAAQYVQRHAAFAPDVIYSPFSFGRDLKLFAQMSAQFPACPRVLCCRARDLFERENVASEAWRAAVLGADGVVTISGYNRDVLRATLPAVGEITVIHSGIDPRLFAPAPSIRKVPRRIVTVARLIEKKALDVLIEACRRLRATGCELSCVIVGDGPLEAALRVQVAAAGLDGVVTILGARGQARIRDELAAAELFVLPCRIAADGDRDMLANALKEAMAMELPVVTSRLAGIDELITDGVDGVLTAPESADALAAAIRTLLADPASRARLGTAARTKVLAGFDAAAEASKLAAVLARAAARGRGGL